MEHDRGVETRGSEQGRSQRGGAERAAPATDQREQQRDIRAVDEPVHQMIRKRIRAKETRGHREVTGPGEHAPERNGIGRHQAAGALQRDQIVGGEEHAERAAVRPQRERDAGDARGGGEPGPGRRGRARTRRSHSGSLRPAQHAGTIANGRSAAVAAVGQAAESRKSNSRPPALAATRASSASP